MGHGVKAETRTSNPASRLLNYPGVFDDFQMLSLEKPGVFEKSRTLSILHPASCSLLRDLCPFASWRALTSPQSPVTFNPMPYDETLAVKLRQLLGKRNNLTEKKMFGGLGFLLSGNICCGAWKEFLILRLGEDAARQVLGEEHTRPFDITGKPMRGWAMVEPAGWQDMAKLRRWVAWAVEFTSDLPAK